MILGIDMDGCLVDFVGAALPRVKHLWGVDVRYEDLVVPRIEKSINAALPYKVDEEALCKAVFQPGFFASMLPREGAIDSLKELYKHGHEIVIITKAYLHSAHIVSEKADWLSMHLRDIDYQTIIVRDNRSKKLVNVDVLVDDDPDNLEHPTAISIAVVHPWNLAYIRSTNRKRPVHRMYTMDALPWMVDLASQVDSKEIDQKEFSPHFENYPWYISKEQGG